MKDFIFEYHRTSTRQPIGILVACKIGDNEIRYGYSLCKTNLDKFDKDFGMMVALKRAEKYDADEIMEIMPRSMWEHFILFSKRAAKYFKGVDVPTYSRALLHEVYEEVNDGK